MVSKRDTALDNAKGWFNDICEKVANLKAADGIATPDSERLGLRASPVSPVSFEGG